MCIPGFSVGHGGGVWLERLRGGRGAIEAGLGDQELRAAVE